MEARFKLRLSRMFQASFASCRSRNLSDIIEKAVFVPQINDESFRFMDSMPARVLPFPSICRPHSSETTESVASSRDFLIPSRKNSERFTPAPCPSAISGAGTCPPASPPLKSVSEFRECDFAEKVRKKKTRRRRKKNKEKENPFCSFRSSSMESNFGGTWWYSSDDEDDGDGREDETETLFSSKSRSSDSSASHRRHKSRLERRAAAKQSSEMGVLPLKGKVKDSFAVVKKSSDPYNDFRTSMVEMIVEKQIFSAKDLEQLLQCFLSLNSHHHHRVILEVFTEIWEALFSDWGS